MKQIIVVGLSTALILLAGCSTAAKVQDQFCQELEKLAEPLHSLEDINADSKIDDIRNSVEKLAAVVNAIDATGIDLGLGALDEIVEAVQTLETKIQDAEDQGTLAEAADDIEQAVVEVGAAYDSLKLQVCRSND